MLEYTTEVWVQLWKFNKKDGSLIAEPIKCVYNKLFNGTSFRLAAYLRQIDHWVAIRKYFCGMSVQQLQHIKPQLPWIDFDVYLPSYKEKHNLPKTY